MAISDVLIEVVSAAIVFVTLNDVFQSVVVPRAVGRVFRPSSYLWRGLWAVWPKIAWALYKNDEDPREDFLALFAPFALVLLLASWVTLLVLGYGGLFWALRSHIAPPMHSYWTAAYYAGTSLLTIGYGDIVARSGAARLISVAAGASGLGVFSVTTAFLFAIFGTFQNREQFVVTIGARAGSPPSGIGLLTISAFADVKDDFPLVFRDAQQWLAMVMESHLAYPHLAFFRSSHEYESWIGTLGSILDAAALLMTTVDGVNSGQARIAYALGRHASHDLAKYFKISAEGNSPGIERSEFDTACERLSKAGYTLRERDESWARFSTLRATYAYHINGLAQYFQIPPVEWVSDRSLVSSPHIRNQMADIAPEWKAKLLDDDKS